MTALPRPLAQALLAAGAGALVGLNLFVFVPVAMLLGNPAEFSHGAAELLVAFAAPAAITVLVAALPSALLGPSGHRRWMALLAALALLLWVQGHVLVWDYGVLDGKPIDWQMHAWRGIVDTLVWVGTLALALLHPAQAGPYLRRMAVTVSLLQGVWVSASPGPSPAMTAAQGAQRDDAEASSAVFRFSPERNVLHIVLDGMQSDVFQEVLEDPAQGPVLRDALSGFVLYADNLGVFPYTHMAVPALLTGQVYDNRQTREAFFERSLEEQSILRSAMQAGFEVDLAAGTMLQMYRRAGFTHAYPVSSRDYASAEDQRLGESARLLDVSLFRLAPHFLKPGVYNDQRWLVQQIYGDGLGSLEFFAHNAFLTRLAERMSVDRNTPVYKMFHLMLSHTPFVADARCSYSPAGRTVTRSAVKRQTQCVAWGLAGLLQRMRTLGIYDRSTIVLMGDHGAWTPPRGLRGNPHQDTFFAPVRDHATSVAMAHPLLLVKPPAAAGELRVSMAPATSSDVPRTVASLLGLPGDFPGQDLLHLAENAQRERRHLIYPYSRSEWSADYLAPIREYRVNGRVVDGDAWSLGTYLPPGGTGGN